VRIDIAETIRELLADRLPVSLEGIGTLHLDHVPAQFGNNRESLLPPSVHLRLDSEIINSNVLREYLQKKYDLKAKTANAYISAFNQKLVASLINYGKVYIKGIGILEKNNAGEFNLEVDKNFIEAFYKAYPEVQAIVKKTVPKERIQKDILPPPPIPEISAEDIESIPSEKVIEKAQKPIPVFDLPKDSEPELSKGNGNPKANIPQQSETIVPQQSKRSNIDWDRPKKVYPKSDIEYKPSIISPLLWTLALLFFLFLLFKACSAILNTGTENNTEVESELNQMNNPFENADTTDALTGSLIADEDINALTNRPEECIIITGTFASSKNVERMKRKVVEAGYNLFEEPYGPYTRVGLSFSCEDVDLVDYIQEVRKQLDKQAWYLDPSFYVEYEN